MLDSMYQLIEKYIKNKKVLILGLGREGRSTLNVLEKVGGFKSITIADAKPQDSKYECISEGYLDCLDDFDIVFKSPGIVLKKDIDEYKCQIVSQMDLFLEHYKSQIIGITGSKGKSTTTKLTYHVFKEAGFHTLFAGNIGIPVFELIDEITDKTIIVLEISCHQLEYAKISPKYSILLNIYQEHLDHYGTFEKYAHAKRNLYRNQVEGDYLVINDEFKPDFYKGKMMVIGEHKLPFKSLREIDCRLFGDHNYFNCNAVYEMARLFGISDEIFTSAVKSFVPLEHRLEYVKNVNGIDFFNDSISTIVESCISAIEAIENCDTILVGGMDRGIDYSELITYLRSCKCHNICFMYASGKRLFDEFIKQECNKNTVYVDDLYKAVKWSYENTEKGKAIVLSPAAASYGYFKNFEERGKVFKELVNEL